jgi:hypothetical protein
MSRILNEYSRGHKPGLAQVLDTDEIKLGPMATTLVNDRSTKMLKLQLFRRGPAYSTVDRVRANDFKRRDHSPCAQCGMLFEAGPGTDRRFDAKFCCDDHRITETKKLSTILPYR